MQPQTETFTFEVTVPGDLSYIPAVRKYVSEMLQATHFDTKFAYRSEIIVDEICNNAVQFGCSSLDATITLVFVINGDKVEMTVKDQGGSDKNRDKLRDIVSGKKVEVAAPSADTQQRGKLGLEIVRMLSDRVDFEIDDNNVTSVRVIRKRDDAEPVLR